MALAAELPCFRDWNPSAGTPRRTHGVTPSGRAAPCRSGRSGTPRRPRYVRHICWPRRCTRGSPARARLIGGACCATLGVSGQETASPRTKAARSLSTLFVPGLVAETIIVKRARVAGRPAKICWCRRADSNRQPIAYEAIALPLSYCGVPSACLVAKKRAPVEAAAIPQFVMPGLDTASRVYPTCGA